VSRILNVAGAYATFSSQGSTWSASNIALLAQCVVWNFIKHVSESLAFWGQFVR